MNTEVLARKYGKPMQEQYAEVEYRFTIDGIAALLAAEREACAKIVEKYAGAWSDTGYAITQTIRERSNP